MYENNVKDIYNCICDIYDENIGLLSGLSGCALSLKYASEVFDCDEYKNKLDAYFNLISCNLEDKMSTFCSGYAGVGWLYQFLNDEKYFNDDTNELLSDFDIYLSNVLFKYLSDSDTDFLHGSFGIVYYIYKRAKDNPCLIKVLELFVDEFSKKVEDSGEYVNWLSVNLLLNEKTYNISMSHGMSSCVLILSKLYTLKELKTPKLKNLIEKSVAYILAQEIDVNKFGSFFPYVALESTDCLQGSRLAWCYGDLGICIALYQVGVIMNRQDWVEKAVEILLYAAKNRRDLNENLVMDACICHGTAGICQIFNRMFWNTGLKEFKNAAEYWYIKTKEMARYKDGYAGYKMWQGKNEGYAPELSLLEGIAGTGLVMLTFENDIEPRWDQCFLMS